MRRPVWLLAIFLGTAFAIPAFPQQADFADLAERVSKDLSKAHAKTAMVFVFSGPKGQGTELGVHLANELATALTNAHKPVRIIDRATLDPLMQQHMIAPKFASQIGVACWLSGQAGAKVLLGGFFEVSDETILLTVRGFDTKEARQITKQEQVLSLNEKWKELLTVVLPQPATADSDAPVNAPDPTDTSGIPNAGQGGTKPPQCTNCPHPLYTEEARKARLECTVVLRAVINKDGHAEKIHIVRACPLGLTGKAIEAVTKWKFKPSTGPDGALVSVWQMIEINFRIYRGPER